MGKKQTAQSDPPNANELELSVFGPGIGECLVVHPLGYNDWMVVDSCLHEPNGQPVALRYLEQLKVDVSRCVKAGCSDALARRPYQGVSAVLREASAAELVCSAALCTDEFRILVASGRATRLVEHTSGVDEFAALLEIQRERTPGRYGKRRGPDRWATEGMRLFHRERPTEIEVWALSPSAQTVTDAKAEIARLLPSVGTPAHPYPSVTPNAQSIVLRVDAPGMSFLLGGDLEVGADPNRGWLGLSLHPTGGQSRDVHTKPRTTAPQMPITRISGGISSRPLHM